MTNSDAVALLATTAGISGVVFVIMNVIRGLFPTPAAFDRFAPVLAVIFGVILAVAFVVVTVSPVTGVAILGAIVSGIIGGALSQNINTVVRSVVKPNDGRPPAP